MNGRNIGNSQSSLAEESAPSELSALSEQSATFRPCNSPTTSCQIASKVGERELVALATEQAGFRGNAPVLIAPAIVRKTFDQNEIRETLSSLGMAASRTSARAGSPLNSEFEDSVTAPAHSAGEILDFEERNVSPPCGVLSENQPVVRFASIATEADEPPTEPRHTQFDLSVARRPPSHVLHGGTSSGQQTWVVAEMVDFDVGFTTTEDFEGRRRIVNSVDTRRPSSFFETIGFCSATSSGACVEPRRGIKLWCVSSEC